MSGICGIVDLHRNPIDPTHIHRMTRAAPHRAPDGTHHTQPHPHATLAHQHHHTTDPTHQTQPLTTPDHTLTLTADLRLDNRHHLTQHLRAKGHLPHPNPTDADILLAAYRTWHTHTAEHLTGDYAFAIHDHTHNHLYAARDPMAMRPLYHRTHQGRITFASEIKQILAIPGTPRDIHEPMVAAHLIGQYAPLSWTFYEGIAALAPGHALLATEHGTRTWRTWDIDPHHRIHYPNEHAYIEHFRDLFTQAVHDRLRTHHAVGLMLSGGLDSGSIAATTGWLLGGHHTGPLAFRTYSWAFDELTSADERAVSDIITSHYGIATRAVPGDDLWPLAGYPAHAPDLDEPGLSVYEPLMAATLEAARADGTRVSMIGDRGDEMVGDWVFDDLGLLLAGEWSELHRSVRAREGTFVGGLRKRATRQIRALAGHPRTRSRRPGLPPWIHPDLVARTGLVDVVAETPGRVAPSASPREQRAGRILSFAGARMARLAERRHAAHGLEVADPWSDVRLARFIVATPPWIVQRGHRPKHIAREAMRGLMPERARVFADKTIPSALFDRGFRDRALGTVRDLIDDSHAAARGWIVREELEAAFEAYVRKGTSFHDFWWPLTLEMWLRAHWHR